MNKLRPADRFKVFHGSYSPLPPHLYENVGSFHAGTYEAAMDRLATAEQDASMAGLDIEKPRMHEYEIRVQPSMLTYDDPHGMYGFTRVNPPFNEALALPIKGWDDWGRPPQRILKYINRYEDPGSLSFLVPNDFVNQGLVHYLGDQFTKKRFYKA